ncbi:MAG: hypothetical protein KDC83_09585 [Flavobacteriales bacterium]|nr:hypothetical protein [Flavobacteriales bacterium]
MKKVLLVAGAAFVMMGCGAAKNSGMMDQAKTAVSDQADLSKYSIDAKSMLSELGGQGTSGLSGDFKQKFGVMEKDGGQFVSTIIKVNDQIDEADLTSKGVEVQTKNDPVWTALCPVDKFGELSKVNGVESIDISKGGNAK